MRIISVKILPCFLLIFAFNIFAQQQSELEKGIALYRQGNYSQAVSVLQKASLQNETKSNADVWNYLGLAYIEQGETKKAQKALEKAIELNPQNSAFRANAAYVYLSSGKINVAQGEAERAIGLNPQNWAAYFVRGTARLRQRKFDDALADADKVIELNAKDSAGYILKSDILLGKFGSRAAKGSTPQTEVDFLLQSVEVLENCLKTCQGELALAQEKREAGKAFYDYFTRDKAAKISDESPSTGNNETPVKILSKPRAVYTDKAKQAGVSGTIKLAVLFGANGTTQIVVLESLGYGLDQEVIKAARNIKFEPATKDGKPISVVKLIEYSFTIY